MLNRLVEYAQTSGLAAEPGFARKDIRWALVFSEDGRRFLNVIELGDTGEKKNKGRVFASAPDMPRPVLQGGGKCHFLVESVEVIAMFLDKKSDKDKIKIKHDYYCSLLNQASSSLPELGIVGEKLKEDATLILIQKELTAKKVKPSESCTVALGASYPLDSNNWRRWWKDFIANIQNSGKESTADTSEDVSMLDIVTGQSCKPLSSHPKIKGLSSVGGLAMGDSMVSFDKEAFRSYNLDSGSNAAMSDQSAAIYSEALNSLIKEHSKRLCGALVVHWFRNNVKQEDDPLAWLEEGEEQTEIQAQSSAGKMLESIRSGKLTDLQNNFYYALTLSGASGRVMVRDWMEGQFEELVANIDAWFGDLQIIRPDGSGPARPPKFLAVIGAMFRDLDEAPAPVIASLWRTAIKNESVPFHAMMKALNRVQASICKDDPINASAMALIKAYHIRKNRIEGDKTMSEALKPYLNENHPSPAYQCGRLMAVLAGLQRAALGDVGAGVIQRYYAAASTTPALVIGRLVKNAQNHISKIDGGLAHWYEDKLASITTPLKDSIPATLTLEEQSLFALGYYQQLADLRTKKTDKTDNVSETKKEN